jgi:hypothetical protein
MMLRTNMLLRTNDAAAENNTLKSPEHCPVSDLKIRDSEEACSGSPTWSLIFKSDLKAELPLDVLEI